MFKKILVANRGETALRIIRACKDLGISVVAVHSTADRNSMHVLLADESVCIGSPLSNDSYLNARAILSAAHLTGVEAIHPGLGFLSENADFANMVIEHEFVFIGPDPEHIRMMGDKVQAKRTAVQAGLQVVPGSEGVVSIDDVDDLAKKIGYPILLKAANGGGGKGMKVVYNSSQLVELFRMAEAESMANFGSSYLYAEKFLLAPRHIEVQIFGDFYGNVVHLGERDCSIQRRHQKIFEETPSPGLTADEREHVCNLAVMAAKAIGYKGLGTIEFLYEGGEFYFMEMNTRMQVEHPITEMITGIDLIKEQIKVAYGFSIASLQPTFKGHSIECRINAEHSETFCPSPGKITHYHTPGGIGVRCDSHVYAGYVVPSFYDSLIAKLIVHAESREECLKRLKRALGEYVIDGIDSLLPLHIRLLDLPEIMNGTYDIHFLEQYLENELLYKANLVNANL